ncbi:Yip1 domain protein [Necator americanus]|uniref:Protein YIPF n=1 Tax=Necator americanus TaxID=51031 RepID=W2TCK6_NECAM|nr:Yip1 domain protein [Necator americanus]ETN79583.1 Yip1 domain protein [Necator americanus]
MDTGLGDASRSTHTVIDLSTPSNLSNFDFYDSGNYDTPTGTTQQHLSGYEVKPSLLPSGNILSSASSRAHLGAAGRLLESRGFGWLLEVDDEDDTQRPLLEELDIDLTDIYYKIRCVLLPLPYFRMKLNIVRESPDFWGPLIVVLAYALLSIYGQFSVSPVVSWILTMWFCGGFIVYFMARALGGDVGYSQVLGVVGYCLIPLVVTGALITVVAKFKTLSLTLGIFGVIWSVYSAGTLLCVDELQSKKPLVLYPVFLLYVYFFSLYSGV